MFNLMVLLQGKMVQYREIITSKALTLFWVRVYRFVWGGGRELYLPPVGFSLITQNQYKHSPWHFATFNNILSETFMPNLVSLTCSSLQISSRTKTGVFRISGFLVKPLQTKIVITTESVMKVT